MTRSVFYAVIATPQPARRRKIEAHVTAGATFDKSAKRRHETRKASWSPVHIKQVEQALRRDVFPT